MSIENSQTTAQETIRDPRSVTIKRALISVTNKNGLDKFAKELQDYGVEILSTGGTAKTLKEAGINVVDVADHTGFPEIMDGRVKTLHPKIHGGILARRDNDSHKQAMLDNNIGNIDLVVVNLYPFTDVVQDGGDYETCIENIDIGGPAMIRASAKNHEFVTVLTDPQDYALVLENMKEHNGATTYALRQKLAGSALALTATYDSNIASWIAAQIDEYEFPRRISFSGDRKQTLRYGENPHQKAALYLDGSKRPGVVTAKQLQGKELSYNNLNDTDAAFELVSEFEEPTVAIIKHANPCGIAIGETPLEAYKQALLCDPVSAFGGIVALNRTLDKETAAEIIKVFSEVIIAPSIETEALKILQSKEKLRVMTTGAMPDPTAHRRLVKTLSGGLLVQDADDGQITAEDLRIVTEREPTEQELEDMIFAFKVAKHVKSNAIIYVKNQATVGIGAGQMSRIDSTKIAAQKAIDAAKAAGFEDTLTKGSVVASDAFFPFADGLIAAADAGATAIIQPGGSIRDEDIIEAADERGLAMVFTDMRHFRH